MSLNISSINDNTYPPPSSNTPYNQLPNVGLNDCGSKAPLSYHVEPAPSDALTIANCLIVHPSASFTEGQHVLVNGSYALTVRHDDTQTLERNQIGVSAAQRTWIGLADEGSQATVEPLPYAPAAIGAITIEIGLWDKSSAVAEVFDEDEMARDFVDAFKGIVMSSAEMLLLEFHGQDLEGTITDVLVLESADEQRGESPGGRRPLTMGIMLDATYVTFVKAADSRIKIKSSTKKTPPQAILAPNFKFEDMGIGGLDTEFKEIFRRAFASRVFPPELIKKLGIQHVKGIILHGPPGTGKTLIARQIGKMLNAHKLQIVNGPEVLSKFVGSSEENIRQLFADAEEEYEEKGDGSGLHIIIFDELDAIFKQRGSTNDGSGVGDSVVNQLLSKMDGVNQLNNILVIGMTNRLDMIDEALLRPGRLEVHVEISLPDEDGRHRILEIHTSKMRTNNAMERDVDLMELAQSTKNFSGAEIEGLIKSATSFALNRHVKVGTMADISNVTENVRVNKKDFELALKEVHPAFGASEAELRKVTKNGIIHYDTNINELLKSGQLFLDQVRTSAHTPLVSILLHGPPGSGKTALGACIAQASGFPFIKLISPDNMVGYSEAQRVAAITKVFADSYKSPLSVVIVDNIERLIDWTPMGQKFSNAILQALLVLFNKLPPEGRRLLVIATSSLRHILTDLGLSNTFHSELYVPPISSLRAIDCVLRELRIFPSDQHSQRAVQMLEEAGFGGQDNPIPSLQIGIKKLLHIIEMARQEPENVSERLTSALMSLQRLSPKTDPSIAAGVLQLLGKFFNFRKETQFN